MYDFLLVGHLSAFHSNYGSVMYHFRTKARYRSEIVIFFIPFALDAPIGGPRRSIARLFGVKKTTG